MTELDELILDLRTHAGEAPAQCASLMRRAANELARRRDLVVVASAHSGGKHRRPKDADDRLRGAAALKEA